jgi:hypothetical protein
MSFLFPKGKGPWNRRGGYAAACRLLWSTIVILFPLLSGLGIAAENAPALPKVAKTRSFERDVLPVLKAYCWKCHGGNAWKAELDLRSFPLLIKGGKSGSALKRGSAKQSLLYQKLVAKTMPPGDALKPTDEHIAAIGAWIDAGAPARYEGGPLTEEQLPPLTEADRDWWSFKKPVRPAVPGVQHRDRVRTPIDAFLLQRLEAKGLTFSRDAERLTLVRRVYFDVIGLPPTPVEVAAFLTDRSPNAWEHLVDLLLASPHFGERWGRHWLDAAGYVDTIDGDTDAAFIRKREGIWKYRDYVVNAVNDDKSYDRFLLEQIAGDELIDWRNAKTFTPEIKELLVATGFLRSAADVTFAPELNRADLRNQVLYDTIQILGSNLLGLTLQCAQCHTHKFDPISHADYYRFRAIFAPAYNIRNWKHSWERHLHDVSAVEKQQIDDQRANVEREVSVLNKQVEEIRRPFEKKLFDQKLSQVPEPIRADTKTAVNTPAEKRSTAQKSLAEKFGPLLKVNSADVDKALDEQSKEKVNSLRQQIAGLQSTKKSYEKIQALWDVGPPTPAFLHISGNYQTPGAEIRPGVIAVLDDPDKPFVLADRPAGRASSGYRTALVGWLTKPDHPLTSRVIVNRIWQQYFGRGIVATPENFGFAGALPTHPELLDWLATEFVRSGWSLKHLHRLILASTAYRQSSHRSTDETNPEKTGGQSVSPETVDPENQLLWRMPLRRLESEIIRDAILTVSGQIEQRLGGPPISIKLNLDGSVEIDTSKLSSPGGQYRRSLYLYARRRYQLTELSVFDQPVIATNCTHRTHSAAVSQSLTMLNGKFIFDQASHFASRVRAEAGTDHNRRIERAFHLALIRKPSAREFSLSRKLLREQSARYRKQKKMTVEQSADAALVDFCQMVLNTNEFLYVE